MYGPTFYAVVAEANPFGSPFECVDEVSLSHWEDDALEKFNRINSTRQRPLKFLRVARFQLTEICATTPA